jgi:membrane protease YdiL (CAAX protease family)
MSAVPSPQRMSLARRVVLFPLSLMIIGALCVVGAISASVVLMHELHQTGEEAWWPPFIMVPAMLFAYVGYVRLVERRPVDELGLRGALPEFGVGYLLGAALFTSVIATLGLLGVFDIVSRHPASVMIAPFLWMIMHAVFEELLFRGVIFRLTERSLGSVAALLISAALFGAAHIFNPGANLFSALALAVEAGFLLGVTFMLTRRLWFCIGVHAAWNFVQGGVFSVPVSGTESLGLLQGRLQGPSWLSGGAFGAEASLVAVAICLLVGVLLYRGVQKRGGVILPYWRRAVSNETDGVLAPG